MNDFVSDRMTGHEVDCHAVSFQILVHGEANEMNRLRMALERKFVDKSVQVSWPKNCQKVQIEFRPQKVQQY